MSSVQIRPPRFISPSRKVRTLRLGFFNGACDPRVRASRFIPRHSLLPASQSTCGHSLATQSAPSVAPKVVKLGRPDSFRLKFFFAQSTNFALGLFHRCVRSARARVSLHPASLTPARKSKHLRSLARDAVCAVCGAQGRQIRPPRFISLQILFCAKYELCAWAFSFCL